MSSDTCKRECCGHESASCQNDQGRGVDDVLTYVDEEEAWWIITGRFLGVVENDEVYDLDRARKVALTLVEVD